MSGDTRYIHNGKFRNALSVPSSLVHTAYEDGTVCSETSAYKIQTPGNHLKERIQHSKPCLWLEKTCVFYFLVLENYMCIASFVWLQQRETGTWMGRSGSWLLRMDILLCSPMNVTQIVINKYPFNLSYAFPN